MDNYWNKYDELVKITKELELYYDIDKVKSYSVYVWTKGDEGRNVFDIEEDEIIFYGERHKISDKEKIIIEKIQMKLKEVRLSVKN